MGIGIVRAPRCCREEGDDSQTPNQEQRSLRGRPLFRAAGPRARSPNHAIAGTDVENRELGERQVTAGFHPVTDCAAIRISTAFKGR